MNAGRRLWIEKIAPNWSAIAAGLRTIDATGAQRRAEAIESIVRALLAELDDTEPRAPVIAPPIARAAVTPPCQFEFLV
jgi:hypothetical protein